MRSGRGLDMRRMCLFAGCVLILRVGIGKAGNPVHFGDTQLKAAVEAELNVWDPTPTDMLNLVHLDVREQAIDDLTGLEYATRLQTLTLLWNNISDLTPLAGLVSLQELKINNNQLRDLSPLSNLVNLKVLDLHENYINDISPVMGLKNLTALTISDNYIDCIPSLSKLTRLRELNARRSHIHDISGLAGVTSLRKLALLYNAIADISVLSGLTNLQELYLRENGIKDLSPISNLKALTSLGLYGNTVSDISPLVVLKMLRTVNLEGNPRLWSNPSYPAHLQSLWEDNPGIHISYDPNPNPPTDLAASDGDYADRVRVVWDQVKNGPAYTTYYQVCRALSQNGMKNPVSDWQTSRYFDDKTAGPGTPYFYWVRTALSKQGSRPGAFSDFDSGWRAYDPASTLYVETYGADDDPDTGQTTGVFGHIQAAIDAASEGMCIVVGPGTYAEEVVFQGKGIHVIGKEFPVISGYGSGPIVSFVQAEDANSTLEGFVLTGGRDGAVLCQNAAPVIVNCLIVGNQVQDANGAAVCCIDSAFHIINCTIAGNQGWGLLTVNSPGSLANSIVWGNTSGDVMMGDSVEPIMAYNSIGWDPRFAEPGYWSDPYDPCALWTAGDYHLQSAAGRWEPATHSRVQDMQSSPCIDAGDPNMSAGLELQPNGNRINQGAYGGTPQASLSPQ